MTIVAPDVGEIQLLQYMLNNEAATDVVMKLYVSDTTPAESDVLGTYSGDEPVDVAYTPITLAGSAWTFTTIAGVSAGTFAQSTFSFSTTNVLHGYFVTDNGGTELLWVERFDAAPFNIPSGGGTIAIDPRIELE